MQISGGSTPSAEEGARFFFFWLALPTFLPSAIFFLTQRALRASPLDPPMQMDKYRFDDPNDVFEIHL